MTVRGIQGVSGRRRNVRRTAVRNRREADIGNGTHLAPAGATTSGLNGALIKDPQFSQAAGDERLTGAGLLHQAMAVAAAADAYSARGRTNISARTLHFLLGRSLELALKAHLLYKDFAEDKLREYGQNLSQLLDQASALSFELRSGTSDADRQAVAVLSATYMRGTIDYPRAAVYQLVASRLLREIVHRAIAAVFVVIWNEDPTQMNLRRASDRALGLCIADDATYEEFPVAAGNDPM